MQKLKKDYSRFLDRKNLAPFPEFADLRRPGNYAKGIYLKKEETKKLMYVYQEKVIPRSLFKLSTEFCGSAKESDRIKGKAPGLFKNVLIFTGVLDGKKNDKQWKANASKRVDAAEKILKTGAYEQKLRDEIFCQLIKQTRECPKPDIELRGWQMLYCCARSFPPSDDMKPFLMCHAAHHAHEELPLGVDPPGIDNVKNIATNIFLLYAHGPGFKYKMRHVKRDALMALDRGELCTNIYPKIPWDALKNEGKTKEVAKKSGVPSTARRGSHAGVVAPASRLSGGKSHSRSQTAMSITAGAIPGHFTPRTNALSIATENSDFVPPPPDESNRANSMNRGSDAPLGPPPMANGQTPHVLMSPMAPPPPPESPEAKQESAKRGGNLPPPIPSKAKKTVNASTPTPLAPPLPSGTSSRVPSAPSTPGSFIATPKAAELLSPVAPPSTKAAEVPQVRELKKPPPVPKSNNTSGLSNDTPREEAGADVAHTQRQPTPAVSAVAYNDDTLLPPPPPEDDDEDESDDATLPKSDTKGNSRLAGAVLPKEADMKVSAGAPPPPEDEEIDDEDEDEYEDGKVPQYSKNENKQWGGLAGILLPPTQEELEKPIEVKEKTEDNKKKKFRIPKKAESPLNEARERSQKARALCDELDELLKWAAS